MPRIDNSAFLVWTVIMKAEDEEGKKIFTDIDKPTLEQMSFSILAKISNAIHETQPIEKLMDKFREGGDPFSATSSPLPTEKSASSGI